MAWCLQPLKVAKAKVREDREDQLLLLRRAHRKLQKVPEVFQVVESRRFSLD